MTGTITQDELHKLRGTAPPRNQFGSMTLEQYHAEIGRKSPKRTTATPKKKKTDKEDAGDTLILQLHVEGLTDWTTEHEFAKPQRGWRFDHAKTDAPLSCGWWLAVEIEGYTGIRTTDEGKNYVGGHQSIDGFKKDIAKYTEALLRHWIVYRTTTRDIREGKTIATILNLTRG